MIRSRYSSGLTLVEVIASLFLVGTLLVAVLVAHSRAAKQARKAQRRIAAVEALDGFLRERRAATDPELLKPAGELPGEDGYRWRTSLRPDPGATALGAVGLGAVVERIELYQPDYLDGETLAEVELLMPRVAQ